jgi:uncharacterized protein (TIGR02145 family)
MRKLFEFSRVASVIIAFGIFITFSTCKKDEVKNAPIASLTATPTSGTIPLTVSFSDQSTNSPKSWLWNFGDGTFSTLQNPGHIFSEVGTYTVQLTVTNNYGSDTVQKTNYIYATNSDGTGTVTDIDGNVYQTLEIGTQVWMAENLKVTHYRNGEAVLNINGDREWFYNTSGAYCWYSNDISWKDVYGALYSWFAVVDSQQLCPAGWHIPTDAEWTILTEYMGGEDEAGGKLKSTRTAPDAHPRWDSPNAGATNISGFSGVPGGYRDFDGTFNYRGRYSIFWSTTDYSSTYAWHHYLNYNTRQVYRGYTDKRNGYSVRCLRD